MDPLAVGIFSVALDNPLMSAMFILGGILLVFGIGYVVIIGAFSDKHKNIGLYTIFLGAGIGCVPALSMFESIASEPIFSIGGYDLKPVFAIVMISTAIFLLYRKIYGKEEAVKVPQEYR